MAHRPKRNHGFDPFQSPHSNKQVKPTGPRDNRTPEAEPSKAIAGLTREPPRLSPRPKATPRGQRQRDWTFLRALLLKWPTSNYDIHVRGGDGLQKCHLTFRQAGALRVCAT